MKKKLLAGVMAGAMVLTCFTGCGSGDAEKKKEKVKLTVWGAEEDQDMLNEMIEDFKKENADTAEWKIKLDVVSESSAKDEILNDPEAAADVFAFADDQMDDMLNYRVLQKITLDKDNVIEENGGQSSGVIQAASKGDELYAYPMTADNGYFMYYNKKYFTERDVRTFDQMLKVAAANKKKVSMSIDDAWYIYSFFAGAGLTLSKDAEGVNECNWNASNAASVPDGAGDGDIAGDVNPVGDGESADDEEEAEKAYKYEGVDVAKGILRITKHKGFQNVTDEQFVAGVKDGSIIAGVSGTWNASVVQQYWGEGGDYANEEDCYGATKLPTFTCAGDQVQMASFAGYKLVGINAYSKQTDYAMMLGRYLTNYDNQVKRFEVRGFRPTNLNAADSKDVQNNPAIAALALQADYADIQRVGNAYWDPAKTFGAIMVEGNTDKTDLQTLLDTMVEEITAKNLIE